jgi:hypothetical protein
MNSVHLVGENAPFFAPKQSDCWVSELIVELALLLLEQPASDSAGKSERELSCHWTRAAQNCLGLDGRNDDYENQIKSDSKTLGPETD